uniref:Tubby-like protein n=1 Tax=Rhabditophanes sp. KR3021 TaxID=114890 RepID=A0AC35TYD0_9BILA
METEYHDASDLAFPELSLLLAKKNKLKSIGVYNANYSEVRALEGKLRRKNERIRSCLEENEGNLGNCVDQLRKFANTQGGLLLDEYREKIWPVLADHFPPEDIMCEDECEESLDSEYDTAPSSFESEDKLRIDDIELLKLHKDWNQVDLDVRRTLDRFPPNIEESKRANLIEEMTPFIVRVLSLNDKFNYYQGFHDVCLTIVLVVGIEVAFNVCACITKRGRFESFLTKSLEKSVVKDLELIYPILHSKNKDVESVLSKAELGIMFALPWPLTWFSHSLHDYSHIVQCFDLFLSSHSLMPIYLASALVLARRDKIFECEPDMPQLHGLLNKIPKDISINNIIEDAQELYYNYPPFNLTNIMLKEYLEQSKKPIPKPKQQLSRYNWSTIKERLRGQRTGTAEGRYVNTAKPRSSTTNHSSNNSVIINGETIDFDMDRLKSLNLSSFDSFKMSHPPPKPPCLSQSTTILDIYPFEEVGKRPDSTTSTRTSTATHGTPSLRRIDEAMSSSVASSFIMDGSSNRVDISPTYGGPSTMDAVGEDSDPNVDSRYISIHDSPRRNGGSTNSLETIVISNLKVSEVDLILTDLKKFVHEPLDKTSTMKCRITRDKSGVDRNIYPSYFLHWEKDEGSKVFLLAARKRKKSKTANYLFSTDPCDLSREGSGYIGKLRSNLLGTVFTIYDGGCAYNEKKIGQNVRQELGVIMYDTNVLGFRGPRKMTILVPGMYDNEKSTAPPVRKVIIPMAESETILANFKGDKKEELVILHNKNPTWNEESQSYVLNFHGRVTRASVKNFQIVHSFDDDFVVMQFGKIDSESFTMDFRYPLSPIQAFAIAMSSFHGKLACE